MTDTTRSVALAARLEIANSFWLGTEECRMVAKALRSKSASVQAEPTEAQVKDALNAFHGTEEFDWPPTKDEARRMSAALKAAAIPAPGQVTGKMVQDALDTFGHPPSFTAMKRALEAAFQAARMPAPVPNGVDDWAECASWELGLKGSPESIKTLNEYKAAIPQSVPPEMALVPTAMERAVMDWVALKGIPNVHPAKIEMAETAILLAAREYIKSAMLASPRATAETGNG